MAADLAHCFADLLDQIVFDLEFFERHLTLPDLGRHFVLELEDVKALESKCDATQRAGVARVSILEGCRQDAEVGRLVQSEHEDQIVWPELLGEVLDSLLIRKTCGTGCCSDEARCRFVNDFRTGRFDAIANGETSHIIPFTEHGNFLSTEHLLLLVAFFLWVGFQYERYSIVKFGKAV